MPVIRMYWDDLQFVSICYGTGYQRTRSHQGPEETNEMSLLLDKDQGSCPMGVAMSCPWSWSHLPALWLTKLPKQEIWLLFCVS